MTKRIFLEETDKTVKEVRKNEIVDSKIAETLMNMKESDDSLLAMALEEIAYRAAAVARAMVLNRNPYLLLAGNEPEQEHEAWDPVVIFVNHPDRTIENLEYAIADNYRVCSDAGEVAEDATQREVLQKLIDAIKVQI